MEHIIQFGITIDDDAIKRNIEESATKIVVTELKNAVIAQIFDTTNTWSRSRSLSATAQKIIKDAFLEHQDEIIKEATAQLVDSMRRSKKYKEALANALEEVNE